MSVILVSTQGGCHVFTSDGEGEIELAGREVYALAREGGSDCVAVVDGQEIWRRVDGGGWSKVATTETALQSITSIGGTIFGGGMDEAVILRVRNGGTSERLRSFDSVPGRSEWVAVGPPLGVRSLTATSDGGALLAAVHVGGIPRSADGGETWAPTIPVQFDVHEVRAHASRSNFVAAAAAVGLCVSEDGGRNWKVISEGLALKYSLAVAVLDDEVLFSVQDGPFASRSQVWRWSIGGERVEQVRDGLPEWLDRKIDTAHVNGAGGRAAVLDGGGNLWLRSAVSRRWERIGSELPYSSGLVIL